ncbi:hypothetical protein [Halapricum sp. CBA1109]|uniref:hypothetical protein n=1 Tax=Halapricum sp. CBA1109 TaxID=2668068 RepID=UPI0018D23709|nr:hypothetical protein [Halapricum sp. CBA1109]
MGLRETRHRRHLVYGGLAGLRRRGLRRRERPLPRARERDDIEATIAVFGQGTNLPTETQEYMGEVWSENGEYTGVDKVGFVSEGITAMAVQSKMDIDGAVVEDFKALDDAIEWAQG